MTGPGRTTPFRLGYVPGVTPDKWVRTWRERRPHVDLELTLAASAEVVDRVRTEALDAGLVRLPIDRTGLHAIPLYTETTVVVVAKDHLLTAAESLTADDLADEVLLRPQDDVLAWTGERPGRPALSDPALSDPALSDPVLSDPVLSDPVLSDPALSGPATTADAMALVAAGVGVLVLPLSLARLHHRRDLVHRPLTGAPTSSVVLAWPDGGNSDDMEELIGVVRGRTVNSSRTPRREEPPPARPSRAGPTGAGRRPARRGTRRR